MDQLTAKENQWASALVTDAEYDHLFYLYKNISGKKSEQIEPQAVTKTKLDKSFIQLRKRKYPTTFMSRKVSVYQSIAVAIVCLIVGYWTSFAISNFQNSHSNTPGIVRDTVQIIKYVQDSTADFSTLNPIRSLVPQKGVRGTSNHQLTKKLLILANVTEYIDFPRGTIAGTSIYSGKAALNTIRKVSSENKTIYIDDNSQLRKMMLKLN
ncbi:MAG: hypothetical protein QM751_09770 [Paludibacteraceae bacterium]